jgi:hypothetical protein
VKWLTSGVLRCGDISLASVAAMAKSTTPLEPALFYRLGAVEKMMPAVCYESFYRRALVCTNKMTP